jgi:hypothetical protein
MSKRIAGCLGVLASIATILGLLVALNFIHPFSNSNSTLTPTPSVSPSDTCIQGYVWREAGPGDHVCVTPKTRSDTAYDNSQADQRHVPGSDTCIQGYVWREAFANDNVCVLPITRANAQYDNSQAPYRVVP